MEPTWCQVAKEQLRSGMPLGISVVKMCADFVKSHNAEVPDFGHPVAHALEKKGHHWLKSNF